MKGLLTEALDYLLEQMSDDGIPVVADVRNVQPPCVLVDPPSIIAQSGSLVQADFPVTVLAPPPGNMDAVYRLLDVADRIIATQVVTGGTAGTYTVGQNDLPSYQLTVRLQLRRT